MVREKIIIFGITENILNTVRNRIDPRQAEIIALVDNDKSKQGHQYMGITITSLEDTCFDDDCWIIVAALSSYEVVRGQLLKHGVDRRKIQPFLAHELCNFCVGSLEEIDVGIVKKIYFEQERTIRILEAYKELYDEYSKVIPFDEEDCFTNNRFISHACGGVVNGRRIMYTNSKEAFYYSIEKGFSLIECDVLGLDMVLAHDYISFYRAKEENYSMMNMRELLTLMEQNPDVHVLIDVKWNTQKEYGLCVSCIDCMIEEMTHNFEAYEKLKSHVIMEVYDEETIKYAYEAGFKMIFTQYRNPEYRCYMNTVNLCNRYCISTIAFKVTHFLEDEGWKNIKTFLNKNVKIYCHSTDSVDEYKQLRNMGVTGVFTNYLTQEDIEVDV